MAMGFLSVGEKVPEVTTPTFSSSTKISAPSRAGAFIPASPTRFRDVFFSLPSGVRKCSAPKKPCSVRRRVLGPPMVHVKLPSIGVVVSSKSLPYRHNPASSRRESRAPRPAGLTEASARMASASLAASALGTESSNPSSPVYPQRVSRQPEMPASSVGNPTMKPTFVRSTFEGTSFCTAAMAPGPWTATRLRSSRYSKVASPWKEASCSLKWAMSLCLHAPFTTM
mmetsp:Transcript_61436/g.139075  ORF Transcript_61436/g.139075 Transcript_61436/m.139075 type:complete len:226 (-) Transcript_61436:448-1125(-)